MLGYNNQHLGTGRQASTERALRHRWPAVVIVMGLGLIVDGPAAYVFWSADGSFVSLGLGLVLHLIAAVVVGTVLWRLWRPTGVVAGLVAGIFVLLWVPPVGVFLAAAYLMWHVFSDRSPQPTDLPPSAVQIEPLQPRYQSGKMARPEPVVVAMEIQPLVDIFLTDDTELKASAIDVITLLKEKDQVAVLRSLLESLEPDVRLLAAAGLAKLEAQIDNALASAQTMDQPAPSSSETAKCLGQLYLAYVHSGLLDATISVRYARLALQEFEHCEELESSRAMTLERAQCYLAAGDYDACLTTLETAIVNSDETGKAALLKMEALFALGRYEELQQEAALAARLDVDPEYQDLVGCWGERAS